MVSRARLFGQWGFTAIIHSARDHGYSSPRRFMNAAKFAEDIEAVLNWVQEPVALYGHSAGAGGAIIAAAGNQDKIKLLFLEACYAHTKEGLLSLYKWFNPVFGTLFGPMIIFWLNLFYGNKLETVSPARLAPALKMPVMLVHGEKDRRFPLAFAVALKDSFSPGQADLYVAKGAGHSDSSRTPGYPEAVKSFLDGHWDGAVSPKNASS
jgi:pimeloyl-ACP methyl ester carboxylesterase